MKHLFTALLISTVFLIAGCESEQDSHSHGEAGDHTHEAPAHQSTTEDSDAVHIGGGDHHSAEDDSTHTHDETGDHTHEEEHSHDDSTHSHEDEEHNH